MSRPDDMSMNDHVLSLLGAFPGSAVLVFREGYQYKAALVDRPSCHPSEPVSECRSWPDDAVDRLHEKAYLTAAKRQSEADDHVSRLTSRRVEKQVPAPSEGQE